MKASQLILLMQPSTPAALARAGALSAWYDASDFASLYQDANGITPVTAVGQLVGLVLDKQYGLARGAQQITDTTFDVPGVWTLPAGVTVSGGTMNFAVAGATSAYETHTSANNNKWYEVAFTVNSMSAGSIAPRLCGVSGTAFTTPGPYRQIILSGNLNNFLGFTSSGAATAVIDNFTVTELPGNHAAQSTGASRPTLNAGGKINFSSGTKSLVTTFPISQGSACTVVRAIAQSDPSILTAQTVGTTYTDTTDHCGLVIANRALTATETSQLTRWAKRRGAAA